MLPCVSTVTLLECEEMDPRVASTRAAILRALLTVSVDTPFPEISVAFLCREAGIARKTFYAHFPDVSAVADEAVREAVRPIAEGIPDALLRMPLTSSGVARHVLTRFAEHPDVLGSLAHLPSEVLARGFEPLLASTFDRIVAVNGLRPADAFVRDYWCALVASACEAIFRTWVARGFCESHDELANLAERLLGTGLDAFLQQLAEPQASSLAANAKVRAKRPRGRARSR